jgi:uncharacterized protein (TIGR02265 family)
MCAVRSSHLVKSSEREFDEPPWDAPLDAAACLRAIPESAQVTGMFLEPLAEAMRSAGKAPPSTRDRYVPFRFYPLREHANLMLEACAAVYPGRPLRQSLRAFGRGAPQALISSTIGKVMLGSTTGVEEAVRAMVKAYALNMKPCQVEVTGTRDCCVLLRLDEVHYFLDSHHVGVFEGVLRYAGAKSPRVTIRAYGPTRADFRCAWGR